MASVLSVYNAALRELGVARLAATTDPIKARYELDNAIDEVKAECLRDGQWNFALRTTEESSDGTPAVAGWQHSITKPADLARLVILSVNDTLTPPLLDYLDEGDHWYTNTDPVYVHYVSNGANYGGLLSAWPADYARFVALTLAERVCDALTGSETKRERIRGDLRTAKRIARSHNSMDRPQRRLPQGSWVTARGDRSNTRNDRAGS
jgi:hypothetical protein